MKTFRLSLILTLVAQWGPAAGSALAEARLFFDVSASSPTASVNGTSNPTLNLNTGNPGTLYLWMTGFSDPTQQFNGLSLDIVSSNPIATGTSFVWDNPFRTLLAANRWGATGTGAALPSTFMVNDANAVRLGGSNLGNLPVLGDDPFFDAATNSWRIGTLNFTANSAGSTELKFGVGASGITFQTGGPNILFGWGDTSIAGNAFGSVSSLADATLNIAGIAVLNDTIITAPGAAGFGRRMLGATPSLNVDLTKTGVEATTYTAVSNSAGLAVTADGAIAGGPQTETISVQLQNNANGSAATGLKSFNVTVDNTADSTAGALQGSADPDDVVNVTATVLAQRTVAQTGGAVALGNYLVGATVSGTANLGTSGDDDNNTRVNVATTGGPNADGISVSGGSGSLFDGASDTGTRDFAGSFLTAGAKSSSVGLGVTTAEDGSVGDNAAYANVAAAYTANAFDASNAEFVSPTGVNTKTLNLGTFIEGTGLHDVGAAITNLLATAGFTAGLDLDTIAPVSGDTSVLFTDLANNEFTNLAGGGTYNFLATLDANNAIGPYAATYTIGLSDAAGIIGGGAAGSQVLTLNLVGAIAAVPEPSSAFMSLAGLVTMVSVALRRRKK